MPHLVIFRDYVPAIIGHVRYLTKITVFLSNQVNLISDFMHSCLDRLRDKSFDKLRLLFNEKRKQTFENFSKNKFLLNKFKELSD